MAELADWSTTAASNNASPPDGWPEGMAPSEVNNTAREGMAVIRRWYNDHLWTDLGDTPTRVDAHTFTLSGDLTATYHFGRALKLFDSTGTNTWYGIITASSYSAPDTTITVSLESGELNANLDQVWTGIPANTSPQAFGNRPNKNFIWQGIMGLNPFQAGTSFTDPVTNTQVADGIFIQHIDDAARDISFDSSVAPTIAQAGYRSGGSLKLDVTTADTSIAATQFCGFVIPIEGYDWTQLAGKPFTISFWVRSTKTGTFCCAVKNVGLDRTFVREYTITTTNTWEKKSVTFDASPTAGTWNYTNGVGLYIYFTLAAGSTFQTTAGAWQTGNFFGTSNQVNALDSTSNDFHLEGIKLEEGENATQIELTTRAEVYEKALRYYCKTFTLGVKPAPATGDPDGALTINSTGIVASSINYHWVFPVPMRTDPTITTYNVVNANANWRQSGSDRSVVIQLTTEKSTNILNGGSCTDDDPALIHATADAGLL